MRIGGDRIERYVRFYSLWLRPTGNRSEMSKTYFAECSHGFEVGHNPCTSSEGHRRKPKPL